MLIKKYCVMHATISVACDLMESELAVKSLFFLSKGSSFKNMDWRVWKDLNNTNPISHA